MLLSKRCNISSTHLALPLEPLPEWVTLRPLFLTRSSKIKLLCMLVLEADDIFKSIKYLSAISF